MHSITEKEIQEHINNFKFRNYTFDERLRFIFLYRIVYTICGKFDIKHSYYPLILFQDPFEEWKFILVLLKQKQQNLGRDYQPDNRTYEINKGIELVEGTEFYYNFESFSTKLEQNFDQLTFYDIENKPFDNNVIYRHIFQAMRHVRQHREETLTEWANRLELNGYFPVTDDLTNER